MFGVIGYGFFLFLFHLTHQEDATRELKNRCYNSCSFIVIVNNVSK